MRKFLSIFWGLLAVVVTAPEACAQLDNSAFTSPLPGAPLGKIIREGYIGATKAAIDSMSSENAELEGMFSVKEGDLRLSLHAFTFFKDNEYFNNIIEGYTLYGTQLNPQLVYYPLESLRLEAGVFLGKDYGNPTLRLVRPTFRATWTRGKQQIILGNIRPHLHHRYIEPMFNFERVMLNPLEEGIQVLYNGDRLFVDQWVDWQRQQYRFSNFQEEVAGGLSTSYRLSPTGSQWHVSVPFQFTAIHNGGQIDTLDRPLKTVFNEALGLEVERNLYEKGKALRFSGYVLGFQDYSFTDGQYPFRNGSALYLNGTLNTRLATFMVSYWQGRRFLSPLGGDLYQSASRTVNNPTFTDPNRRLLFVRVLRDFRISDAAALTARVEPVFDFNARLLDYSFAMYLNFRQEWLLGNVGKRERVGQ